MKPKIAKCKICGNKFELFNSLRPCCSYDCLAKYAIRLKENKDKKDWKDKKAEMKITTHAKEFKKHLQNEVNKLSRMIDAKFGYDTCIDCGKPFGKQIDAAHFHGRGSNSTLRYNLDNLHSAKSDCNLYSDTHKQGYEKGLVLRYGPDYANYVINEMQLKYKEIHLSEREVVEKLKVVRFIIRHFGIYHFESSIKMRLFFNNLIGIYK